MFLEGKSSQIFDKTSSFLPNILSLEVFIRIEDMFIQDKMTILELVVLGLVHLRGIYIRQPET